MKTQLELEVGRKHEARNAFQNGVKKCTQCIPLWTTYADFELKEGQVLKDLLKCLIKVRDLRADFIHPPSMRPLFIFEGTRARG